MSKEFFSDSSHMTFMCLFSEAIFCSSQMCSWCVSMCKNMAFQYWHLGFGQGEPICQLSQETYFVNSSFHNDLKLLSVWTWWNLMSLSLYTVICHLVVGMHLRNVCCVNITERTQTLMGYPPTYRGPVVQSVAPRLQNYTACYRTEHCRQLEHNGKC